MASLSKKALVAQTEKIIKTSAVLYLGLAVAAVLLMGNAAAGIAWEYSAPDGLASGTYSEFGKAEKTLYSIELRYIVAGILAFSSVLLILLSTRFKQKYNKTVKAKISGYRWIYTGLTFGLLVSLATLFTGQNSYAVLKMAGLVTALAFLFAWIAERESVASGKARWFGFNLSVLAALVALLPLLSAKIGTAFYGSANYKWYVYALCEVVIIGFVAFIINQMYTLKARGNWKDYEFSERNYFVIDAAVKVAVTAILIVAFYR